MDKLLVIVRHGDYGNGYGDEPLSKFGLEQMQKLRKVINAHITEKAQAFGEEMVIPIFFSFSSLSRAVQSIRELRWAGRDIVITSEGDVNRRDIREPKKILDKVLGLANYYGASVIIIVAHGQMPAVLAETAYQLTTGKTHAELPYVGNACGYITNMSTGEVTPIGYDSLDEKKPMQPVVQETSRPVIRSGPPRVGGPVRKGGPNDIDDDIPF